jgi:hypothetical protein
MRIRPLVSWLLCVRLLPALGVLLCGVSSPARADKPSVRIKTDVNQSLTVFFWCDKHEANAKFGKNDHLPPAARPMTRIKMDVRII